MEIKQLKNLQHAVQEGATFLGREKALFGMTLAGIHWTDGISGDDYYFPTDKLLSDFTKQECLDTLKHIRDWLDE